MHRGLIKYGSLLAAVTVTIGAFAAHGLKKILTEYGLSVFETGVRYQFYHTIAILLAGIIYKEINSGKVILAASFFFAGIILFSGSLYLLALNENNKWLGAITPFGGICFIAGWIILFISASKSKP